MYKCFAICISICMKLSKYAKQKGVHYKTAYNWFKAGQIPGAYQHVTGTIIVPDVQPNVNTNNHVVTYSRVSNNSRRKELEYQVERIRVFCLAKGIVINKEYKEVASGMNDNRKQLWDMINSNPQIIIIENKDRLTRFGFNYLNRLLKRQGCKIIVINESKEDEQDLIRDLVSIITSFCCRLYGLRRGYNKAKRIRKEIEDDSIQN